MNQLKQWTIDNDIDLYFTAWAERLILAKSQLDCDFKSPFDIVDMIVKEIYKKGMINIYKETINIWIQFAINEYSIYSKYDIATITMGCFYIGVCNILTNEISEEDKDKNKNVFISYLKNLNLFSFDKVVECGSEIGLLFMKEDDNSDEDTKESDIVITRTNSASSIEEIFISSDSKAKELDMPCIRGIDSCDNNEFLGKKKKRQNINE